MMIVVPSFAQGQHAKQEVVLALIVDPKGLAAPQMTDRVDAPSHVMDQENACQAAPQQPQQEPDPSSDQQAAEKRWHQQAQDNPEGKEGAHNAQQGALAKVFHVAGQI